MTNPPSVSSPSQAMTDGFVSSTENVFQLGQTVRAKVTNLDEEKRRFLVSLKASELSSPEGEEQERLTRGQQERRAAMEMISGRGEKDREGETLRACTHSELAREFTMMTPTENVKWDRRAQKRNYISERFV